MSKTTRRAAANSATPTCAPLCCACLPIRPAVTHARQPPLTGGVRLRHTRQVSFSSLDPLSAPETGGTRMLARGPGLVPHGCHGAAHAEPKQCRWNNAHIGESVVRPATVSEWRAAIVCYTPPLPLGWEPGAILNFSVSLNSHDWAPPIDFFYEHLPALPNLSPGSGPATGRTTVRLYGASMRDVPDLACYFGAARVLGYWETDHQIACASPDLHTAASTVVPMPFDVPTVVGSVLEGEGHAPRAPRCAPCARPIPPARTYTSHPSSSSHPRPPLTRPAGGDSPRGPPEP